MRRVPRWRTVLGLTLFGMLAGTLTWFPAVPAEAQTIVPFDDRFTGNFNGAITIIGNNVVTCPDGSSCDNAQDNPANGSSSNNNNYSMVNLDQDGFSFPFTFNSSNAQLSLPANATVRFAGLYWGARQSNSFGGLTPNPIDRMLLRLPGDVAYRTIASDDSFGPVNDFERSYQQFANVTSLVQSAGSGVYWGANVAAGLGPDRYGGWSLVIAYEDPTQPLRNLSVFDGFSQVASNSSESFTITGFLAPLNGIVDARLGMVAYDGDRGNTGDEAFLNQTRLATAASGGTNFFNSTNDLDGRIVTARQPAHENMFGFDIKQLGVPGAIPNGAEFARIRLSTLSERYSIGVVTTAINLYAPNFTTSRKAVANLSGHDPAAVGDVLEYTLTYTNSGLDPAENVVVTDPLPPNTTFVSGSLTVATGPNLGSKTDAPDADQAEYLSGSRTLRIRLGTGAGGAGTPGGILAPGVTTTVRFRVQIDAGAAGTTVANRGSVAYEAATSGLAFTYDSNLTVTPVVPNADLAVIKSTVPDPVAAGGEMTSTIVVVNNGPDPAVGVVVTDTLAAGVGLVGVTPSSCTSAAQVVSCNVGDLASGASVTVVVRAQVPPGSVVNSVSDVARVSSSTVDPDLSNNAATSSVAVVRRADLVVEKLVDPATVAPGGVVSFPITVTNQGPSTAVGARVADVLDAAFIDVSVAAPCTVQANAVQCPFGDLAPGASVSTTITARLSPAAVGGAVVANTVSASALTTDPVTTNNTSTVNVTAAAREADLVVSKVVTPGAVVAGGGGAAYTITVENDGPSDATGVVLDDAVPAGFTVTSASTSRGTCATGPPVVCTIGALPAGASATITLDVDVGPGVAVGEKVNSASVDGVESDPVSANNTDSASLEVTASADLAIVKTGSSQLVPGGTGSYLIDVTNTGPSTARAVTLVDELPTGIIVNVPLPAGCGLTAGALTCDLGDLAPDTSRRVAVSFTVDSGFAGSSLVNTASASSSTPDPLPSNNEAVFTSSTQAQADLRIVKQQVPVPAVAGAAVSWSLQAFNDGPSDAAGVVITDTLPVGLSGVVVPAGCSLVDRIVTCAVGAVAADAVSATFEVSATVPATVAAGASLTNTAVVSASTPDPAPSSNTQTVTSTVVTRADLSVTKTTDEPSLPAGAGLPRFTITVRNDGPSVAQNVRLVDTLPFDAIIEVVTPVPACSFTGVDVECAFGSLAPGASVEVQIDYFTTTSVPPGVYTNEATATSATQDTDPADNTGRLAVTVLAPSVDVNVSKTGSTDVDAGGTFAYQIDVQNAGPSTAFDVTVTDVLPAGLIPESATTQFGTCTIAAQTVTCQLPFVYEPPYEEFNAPILITGNVAPDADGTVTNTATAETTEPDRDETNNTDSIATTVTRTSNVTLTKESDVDQLVAGGVAPYTVTVTNAGPSVASDSVVTDLLPDGVAFVAEESDSRCAPVVGGDVVCTLGTLAPLDTVVLRVVGRVDPSSTAGLLSNTAVFTSSSDDPFPDDDTAVVDSPVTRSADLQVSKTAVSETVSAGDRASFNVTVSNDGPSTASDVEMLEILPPGTTLVSIATTPSVPCDAVRCSIGSLRPGETVSALVTVAVMPSQPAGTITNVVSVSSPTPAAKAGPRTAAASVEVLLEADVSIVKTLATTRIVAGQPISYEFVVHNAGPSDAINATFVDPFPPGTALLGGSASPGTVCQVSTDDIPIVSCTLPRLLAGETVSGHLELSVASSATGVMVNTAAVGSDALDPNNEDNVSTVSAPVVAADSQVDLVVAKSGPADLVAGDPFTYHIDVSNQGASVSTAATVTDELPVGLTPTAATIGAEPCAIAGQVVTCAIGLLTPGGAAPHVMITGNADPSIEGATVDNTATAAPVGTEIDSTDNSSTVTSDIIRSADLAIVKSAATPTFAAGSTADWTLSVTNAGPSTATDVVVTDSLPAGITLDVAGTDSRCALSSAVELTCALGVVPPGGQVTLAVSGAVDDDLEAGTEMTNGAAVSSSAVDANTSDNESSVTSGIIRLNDIAVDVVADRREVAPGARASYTVSVTNSGPSGARDVELAIELPSELTDVLPSGPGPAGLTRARLTIAAVSCSRVDASLVCVLGDIPAGTTIVQQFSGRVPPDTPDGTSLVATAAVSARGTDSVAANNRDSDVVRVVLPAMQPTPTTTTVPPTTTTPTTTTTVRPTTTTTTPRAAPHGGGPLSTSGTSVGILIALAACLVGAGGVLLIVRGAARRRS